MPTDQREKGSTDLQVGRDRLEMAVAERVDAPRDLGVLGHLRDTLQVAQVALIGYLERRQGSKVVARGAVYTGTAITVDLKFFLLMFLN